MSDRLGLSCVIARHSHSLNFFNPLFLVTTKWEKLPLPERSKRALQEAIKFLPFFLRDADGIDGEVFDFTQKGGWQKLDTLLPLLYRSTGWSGRPWISHLGLVLDELKVSDLSFLWGCL